MHALGRVEAVAAEIGNKCSRGTEPAVTKGWGASGTRGLLKQLSAQGRGAQALPVGLISRTTAATGPPEVSQGALRQEQNTG